MTNLLERIDAPQDLKPLTHDELAQVAKDVRETIISVITERGGHLASNLGVVELTLALHRAFDSPVDRIVWDTTNQCYTHKLVTGRRDEFKDIRLEGGLSGFGEPSESEHDTLAAGHAGTGLSIALGIAEGAAIRKEGSWTIAVVGDGAMTSGSSCRMLRAMRAEVQSRVSETPGILYSSVSRSSWMKEVTCWANWRGASGRRDDIICISFWKSG